MTYYTADHVEIVEGMTVWSNDLRRVIVSTPDKYDPGWFDTRTPDGGRGPLLNGDRMATRHPGSGELA